MHRRDLRQDIGAVPILVDHLLNTAYLSLDAAKLLETVHLGFRIDTDGLPTVIGLHPTATADMSLAGGGLCVHRDRGLGRNPCTPPRYLGSHVHPPAETYCSTPCRYASSIRPTTPVNGHLVRRSLVDHSAVRRNDWAFSATMIVLTDIRTAPNAGDSVMPHGASTPAASGMATTLYPAAHHRFCTILR